MFSAAHAEPPTAATQQTDGASLLERDPAADGSVYPPAGSTRHLEIDLPLLGTLLGDLPEALDPRVYNSDTSRELIERMRLPQPKGDWFAVRSKSADVVSVDLDDGRVRRIYLQWSRLTPPRLRQIRRTLGEVLPEPEAKSRLFYLRSMGFGCAVESSRLETVRWIRTDSQSSKSYSRTDTLHIMMCRRTSLARSETAA